MPGDYDFCLASKELSKGNYKAGISLMQDAASWGNKSAQTILGIAYFKGDGVNKDRAVGLAWLHLAAEREEFQRVELYQWALSDASPQEKAQALTLYGEMQLKYADDVAAARATRLYQRKMRELASNPVYGSGRCIAGVNAPEIRRDESPKPPVQSCSLMSEQAALDELATHYDHYYGNWARRSTVTVGPPRELVENPK